MSYVYGSLSQREYFEKANSLFSGVNNPFASSSSYNKVSTREEDGAAQKRLRWERKGK